MKIKRLWPKRDTILKKLLLPIMFVVLLQSVLYAAVLLFGGTLQEVKDNNFNILDERSINRKNYLSNEMIHRWSNLTDSQERIRQSISKVLTDNAVSAAEIKTNASLNEQITQAVGNDLVDLLRKNSVTGAFVVLDGPSRAEDISGAYMRAGLYLRDLDPSTNNDDNSDLLMERGMPTISKSMNIPLDSYWSAGFSFSSEADNAQFFYKPLLAARNQPGADSENYGYWSPAFELDENTYPVITYSLPLIDDSGEVYGVMGIDVTMSYLLSQMRSDDSTASQGSYVLCLWDTATHTVRRVASSGPLYQKAFGEQQTLSYDPVEVYQNIYTFPALKDVSDDVYGSVQPLTLYNSNTPFISEQWALVGMAEQNVLLASAHQLQFFISVSLVVALVFGLAGVYYASQRVTRPITRLVRSLQTSDPTEQVALERIHIAEIDELSLAIEKLSKDVADSASKISKIISTAQIPIGVFEHRDEDTRVFCSQSLTEILGWSLPENGYLSRAEFDHRLQALYAYLEDRDKTVFRFPSEQGSDRWVQLLLMREHGDTIGVFTDITNATLEKQKIEYERDFDVLTGLYNRRSFLARITELFDQPEKLGTACLIMWDLDNLKFINDTYGHDWGDRYLQLTASQLRHFSAHRSVVARISGDEFYVFLYGYPDQNAVRAVIDAIWRDLDDTYLPLPDATQFKLRISAGIAWYPDDADSYDQLAKLADFAMYSVKHTTKGQIQEFDAALYQADSILVNGQEDLNQLIEEKLLRYAFQPIVDAHTGALYALEALMRPTTEALTSPYDVLRLARVQAKLYHIEHLSWFESMRAFARLCEQGAVDPSVRLFINSISSVRLTREDLHAFESEFAPYLDRLVVEITESEPLNETYTFAKSEIVHGWHGHLAIDDFGSGYNSESMLLLLSPDLVKMDMSIVRNIDTDTDRQALLQNLLHYAKQRNIKVIAEGVETREEMETLIAFGVDYLQGFYLAKPGFTVHAIDPALVEQIKAANDPQR